MGWMWCEIGREYWHVELVAGPSTAPLAMRLREAPLRMTPFISNPALLEDLRTSANLYPPMLTLKETLSLSIHHTLRLYVDTA